VIGAVDEDFCAGSSVSATAQRHRSKELVRGPVNAMSSVTTYMCRAVLPSGHVLAVAVSASEIAPVSLINIARGSRRPDNCRCIPRPASVRSVCSLLLRIFDGDRADAASLERSWRVEKPCCRVTSLPRCGVRAVLRYMLSPARAHTVRAAHGRLIRARGARVNLSLTKVGR